LDGTGVSAQPQQMVSMPPVEDTCRITAERTPPDGMIISLSGGWKIGSSLPRPGSLFQQLGPTTGVRSIRFDTRRLESWDSSLLFFLNHVMRRCREASIAVDPAGLPPGVQGLLSLAAAVPERAGAGRGQTRISVVTQFGASVLAGLGDARNVMTFVGECILAGLRAMTGGAGFRASDLFQIVQSCGPQALPIVSLISVLVGLILAFVGAIQLKMFGAEIYVANLVGLGMAREMGAMMAAVIMAGRTGAAFAAQLGTMQVNEEIDALVTVGLSPMAFLVLPRMIAMILMMPLLCLYADLMGILGGAAVAVGMMDIGLLAYLSQTQSALSLTHFGVGIVKSAVFGVIVAVAGCMRGMQCGRSASSVGDAATSAVVTAIVWIIVADATLTVIASVLDI